MRNLASVSPSFRCRQVGWVHLKRSSQACALLQARRFWRAIRCGRMRRGAWLRVTKNRSLRNARARLLGRLGRHRLLSVARSVHQRSEPRQRAVLQQRRARRQFEMLSIGGGFPRRRMLQNPRCATLGWEHPTQHRDTWRWRAMLLLRLRRGWHVWWWHNVGWFTRCGVQGGAWLDWGVLPLR